MKIYIHINQEVYIQYYLFSLNQQINLDNLITKEDKL